MATNPSMTWKPPTISSMMPPNTTNPTHAVGSGLLGWLCGSSAV
jgi:hypothetical protein